MILHKTEITEQQITSVFPSLVREGYKYGVELSALKAQSRKTFISAHLSAYRYREENGFIFREILPQEIPCVRCAFDKPMRSTDRSKMLIESVNKMREKMFSAGLDSDHIYLKAISTI